MRPFSCLAIAIALLPPLITNAAPTLSSGQSLPSPPGQGVAQCNAVTIRFSLKAGESFHQRIGDLTFNVQADRAQDSPNGWEFSLEDAVGRDMIAPVNLPLRFNPWQILGPGYGLTATDSLKNNRELRFLLRDSDLKVVDPLWHDALWPYSAADPDHAADKYIGALSRLPLGLLRLKILQADIPPDDIVRSASFEAEFVVPAEFQMDTSLEPRPAACPPPFRF